jgi:hypothetical protein
VTQIDYYTERVKRMVGKVLTGNGITAYGNGAYSLIGGDEVFAHHSRHRTPISGSAKYRGLTRAWLRCECCGARLLLSKPCTSEARREVDGVFCALEGSGRVLLENELALCIADAYPVTLGHSLVIPRRHVADGLTLHQLE